VIVGTVISFKRIRVSNPMEPNVLVLIVKALMVAFPLPQLSTLSVEATVTRPSTRVVLEKTEFEDAFINLTFGQAPFNFPTLIEEERQLMEDVVGTRSCIGEANLEVVRLLKTILTILSDISMASNESYNCHLNLTGQIMSNVRNLHVYLLFS
jgi:hypothetical protein